MCHNNLTHRPQTMVVAKAHSQSPANALALANPADPSDRTSAGSFSTGAKEQPRTTTEKVAAVRGRSRDWLGFHTVWKAQSIILFMILFFGAVGLFGSGFFTDAY